MNAIIRNFVVFAFVLLAGLPFAGRASAQGLLEACEKEIDAMCDDITPGNGRLAACLYSHEDHLSAGCADAFADVGDIFDLLVTRIGNAMAICADDVQKQCAGTDFGQGRILSCLSEKSADISPECKAVTEKFSEYLGEQ